MSVKWVSAKEYCRLFTWSEIQMSKKGGATMKLDELDLEEKSKRLRKIVLEKNFYPNNIAIYFLDTPSARWEEDGVYNLAFKYSDKVLSRFLNSVKNNFV